MISGILIWLFQSIDYDAKVKVRWKYFPILIVGELLTVTIEFGNLWLWNGRGIIVHPRILLPCVVVLKSAYSITTVLIDEQIKQVYQALNYICGFIFLIQNLISGHVGPNSYIEWFLFVGLIFICEKLGGFERGDSEYLCAAYLYYAAVMSEPLLMMLVVMLLASVFFDIFRKNGDGKGGSVAYTPFLFLSEIILNVIRMGLSLI